MSPIVSNIVANTSQKLGTMYIIGLTLLGINYYDYYVNY